MTLLRSHEHLNKLYFLIREQLVQTRHLHSLLVHIADGIREIIVVLLIQGEFTFQVVRTAIEIAVFSLPFD